MSVDLYLHGKLTLGDKFFSFGSEYAPAELSSPNDLLSVRRVSCLPGLVTRVYDSYDTGHEADLSVSYDPSVVIAVANVDGNFGWATRNNNDLGSAMMDWQAGVPLILGAGKTTTYSSNGSTRLASATAPLGRIYFYPTETPTDSAYAYVEVLVLS